MLEMSRRVNIPQSKVIHELGGKMRSKLLLVANVLIVLAMLLAGCAPATPQVVEKVVEKTVVVEKEKVVQQTVVVEKDKVVEKEKVVTATPKPAPAAKPKLTFWMNYNFSEPVNVLIKSQVQEWAKANNAEVEVLIAKDADLISKWSAAIEAPNTLPDVSTIFSFWLPRWYDAGLLLDVSDAFAEADKLGGGFLPAAKEAATIGGKQWSIPYIGSTTPAYWRMDKLAEGGLKEPPKTYAELLDVCKKINKKGSFWCYGLNLGGVSDNEVAMNSLLWSYGGSVVAKDGKTITINSPETLAMLKWLKDMQDAGSFPPDAITADDSGNNKYYQTGVVAHITNTGSVLAWLKTNDETILKATRLGTSLAGPAGLHGTSGFGATLGVFKTTKYPELAKSLAVWFSHPDRVWARCEAVAFGNLPVHVDAAKDKTWDDPYLKPFIEQLKYGHPTGYPGPPTKAANEVYSQLILSKMAISVITGEKTPEQAIKTAEDAIKKIYAEFPPKL
jgi:multiple sugar transport system substrate-binding protein